MRRSIFITLGLATVLPAALAEAGPSPRHRSAGTSLDLGRYIASTTVVRPADTAEAPVIGMAIRPSDNKTVVWYGNGTYSVGSTLDWEATNTTLNIVGPAASRRKNIAAIAMDSQGIAHTFYTTGERSEGVPFSLEVLANTTTTFAVPTGKEADDIVGVAIAKSNDRVYTFWNDGTRSVGTLDDLAAFQQPTPFTLPANRKVGHIIDMAISNSGRVYTWYHDVENGLAPSSLANEIDSKAMSILRRYRLPGMSVAASKNGRVVFTKGYGFSDFNAQVRMSESKRCFIGSVSKIITALSAMHLHETNSGFDVGMSLYGNGGALSANSCLASQATGVERFSPIVAKAIAPNGRVYTWYQNGTVTSGTSTNPDLHSGPTNFSLAPGFGPEDVRAIAIDESGSTWVWYDDRTYGTGSTTNLESVTPRDKDVKVSVASGRSMANVLDVAFAANGRTYVYYHDGMRSIGDATDFGAVSTGATFNTGSQDRYDISGIGIAKTGNKKVYAFYSNGVVTHGSSRNLSNVGTNTYDIPNASAPDRDWNSWYHDMNVDHLLSHTAGFARSGDVDSASTMVGLPDTQMSYQDLHDYMLRARKLDFAPGSRTSYSNHGMGLVSHIVSEVSGQSFRNYARVNIIDAIGLDIRAAFYGQQSIDVMRHQYNSNGDLETFVHPTTHLLGLGAGGWKSSTTDLVRLMLATDRLSNHPDVLSSTTLDLMESRPYPNGGRAHGWEVQGGRLAHGGALGGGNTEIAKFPADVIEPGSTPINVAVCTPIDIPDELGGKAVLDAFVRDIASAVHEASISSNYDLY